MFSCKKLFLEKKVKRDKLHIKTNNFETAEYGKSKKFFEVKLSGGIGWNR